MKSPFPYTSEGKGHREKRAYSSPIRIFIISTAE